MRHHQAGDPRIHNKVNDKRGPEWRVYLEESRNEIVKTDKKFYEYWVVLLEETLSTL